jgi:hypothetical protein
MRKIRIELSGLLHLNALHFSCNFLHLICVVPFIVWDVWGFHYWKSLEFQVHFYLHTMWPFVYSWTLYLVLQTHFFPLQNLMLQLLPLCEDTGIKPESNACFWHPLFGWCKGEIDVRYTSTPEPVQCIVHQCLGSNLGLYISPTTGVQSFIKLHSLSTEGTVVCVIKVPEAVVEIDLHPNLAQKWIFGFSNITWKQTVPKTGKQFLLTYGGWFSLTQSHDY